MDFYQLLVLIIIFSVIQSIAGVGILLFGTPILLIFGYSFSEVLWILVPISCALSLFQIIEGYEFIERKGEHLLLTAPILMITLFLVIQYKYILDMKSLVGFFLVLISLCRMIKSINKRILTLAYKSKKLIFPFIAIIHGLSNLGGAPLAIFISSLERDRLKANVNIAFIYFILALSQLFIITVYDIDSFKYNNLIFIPVAIVIHAFVRRNLFFKIDNSFFRSFINTIVLFFGIICLIN